MILKIISRLLFLFFAHVACRILVPRPGIEPMLSAMKAQSPNHWTARGFLFLLLILPWSDGQKLTTPPAYLPGRPVLIPYWFYTHPVFLPPFCHPSLCLPSWKLPLQPTEIPPFPSFLETQTKWWEFSVGIVRRSWKVGNAFFFFFFQVYWDTIDAQHYISLGYIA